MSQQCNPVATPASSSAAADNACAPLFLEAVTAKRAPGLAGEILLAHYRRTSWIAGLAVACAIALALLFAWGSYTKRSTASGFITPSGGVAKIHAPQPGFVVEVLVAEGSRVKAGDKLFVLSTDRQTGEALPYQLSIVESMRARAKLIETQVRAVDEAAASEIDAQRARRDSIQQEIAKVRGQWQEMRARLVKAEQDAQQYKAFLGQGLVTRDQSNAKDTIAADLSSRVAALEREEIGLKRDADAIVKGVQAAAARQAAAAQALEREAAGVREQLLDAESRRRIIISAPRDGMVTLVQATPGSFVDTSRPMAAVSNADAPLEATIYADGRAVAQLQIGRQATLRVAALPHQTHGTIPARVQSISKLPAVAQDRTDAMGAVDKPGEPLYSVTLKLEQQATSKIAPGAHLRAGMRVDVDFLLEKRTLWQWTLEPLTAARKRLLNA